MASYVACVRAPSFESSLRCRSRCRCCQFRRAVMQALLRVFVPSIAVLTFLLVAARPFSHPTPPTYLQQSVRRVRRVLMTYHPVRTLSTSLSRLSSWIAALCPGATRAGGYSRSPVARSLGANLQMHGIIHFARASPRNLNTSVNWRCTVYSP